MRVNDEQIVRVVADHSRKLERLETLPQGGGGGTGPIIPGAGGWTLLGLSEPLVDVASVVFATIDQTYKHLALLVQARITAGSSGFLLAQVNGDAASHYAWVFMHADVDSVQATGDVDDTSWRFMGAVGPSGPTDHWAQGQLMIVNYASAAIVGRAFTAESWYADALTTDGLRAAYAGGGWPHSASPAAISRLTITPSAGSIAAGSVFHLYGIT